MDTIEAAVLLAASHHATLIPLSLILSPQASGKGARLEHIQQSKDFLEAVQQKALRHHVPLERFEVFTGDVVQSMLVLVDQLGCDGILLALRGRNGSLLGTGTIEQLMAMRPCPLSLIYLPSRESSWMTQLRERVFHWRPGHRQRADQHVPLQPVLEEQGAQEVVAAQPHSGNDEGSFSHAKIARSPDLERRS